MSNAFFGVQLALALPAGHQLRQNLSVLVREFRDATAVPAQRSCWTRAATALGQAASTARFGTWDLIRTNADSEYEDWASGLEAMAQWPLDEFGNDGTLLLASLIILVAGGSNADRTLGDACDLPEMFWQSRGTYRRLVQVPPTLNFTNVLASGLYLAPRPDHPGFSEAVLTGEGFEYLKPIRD